MKKRITILMSILLLWTAAACGAGTKTAPASVGAASIDSTAEAGENGTATEESSAPVLPSAEPEAQDRAEDAAAEPEEPTQSTGTAAEDAAQGAKTLVAYFSCTGTTQGVAQTIAEALGADLFEIIPAEPYSDEDLNYHDDNSRSTREQNDPSVRPEIASRIEDLNQYDVIFVGFPIWWGEEPRILDTFTEQYDFSGKTMIPFCTSGGSGIGSSGDNMAALTDGATWLDGKRFSSGVSVDEILAWAGELGVTR